MAIRPSLIVVALLLAVAAPVSSAAVPAISSAPARESTPTPEPLISDGIVIEGRGAAHGMGLAMDGVLGQARAGWIYRKTLQLFYTGTTFARASGTVRVGLAQAPTQVFSFTDGGRIIAGSQQTEVPANARVTVTHKDGQYGVSIEGLVKAAQTEILPSPIPSPTPSPTPDPTPTPTARTKITQPVWLEPAFLTKSEATGKRYRGKMEVRVASGGQGLWAINHVDLETYVSGIAEEKGAGWPAEGLKVLAVAARSLAQSTRTWYSNHHAEGFDICASSQCQVYLGFDGEELAMTQAVKATSGEILVYKNRSILAMYHGNGGGQTDSYRLIYGDERVDAYPYLSSVIYPYANPSQWQRRFSQAELAARLNVKTGSQIEILKRGQSPRIRLMRVNGTEMTGLEFMSALDLPSSWFEVVSETKRPVPVSQASEDSHLQVALLSIPSTTRPSAERLPLIALSTFMVALSGVMAMNLEGMPLWRRRRLLS